MIGLKVDLFESNGNCAVEFESNYDRIESGPTAHKREPFRV